MVTLLEGLVALYSQGVFLEMLGGGTPYGGNVDKTLFSYITTNANNVIHEMQFLYTYVNVHSIMKHVHLSEIH